MRIVSWAVFIGLLQFTAPNGLPVWFVPSQIVRISAAAEGQCAPGGQTVITTGNNGEYCVRESPTNVAKSVEQTK